MKREWTYSTKNLEEAMEYVWENRNKLNLYVYPVEQNLIVASVPHEEDMYLKYTTIIDPGYFNSLKEFAEEIATSVIGG